MKQLGFPTPKDQVPQTAKPARTFRPRPDDPVVQIVKEVVKDPGYLSKVKQMANQTGIMPIPIEEDGKITVRPVRLRSNRWLKTELLFHLVLGILLSLIPWGIAGLGGMLAYQKESPNPAVAGFACALIAIWAGNRIAKLSVQRIHLIEFLHRQAFYASAAIGALQIAKIMNIDPVELVSDPMPHIMAHMPETGFTEDCSKCDKTECPGHPSHRRGA